MSFSKSEMLEWQEGLRTAFEFREPTNGDMPQEVATLTTDETKHRKAIMMKGYGFRVLMLSYQEFAMQTLKEAPEHGNVINPWNYALNWAAFRRLRCAWNAYDDGYYYDAASYLRSVLETTMYLSCVLSGCFGFQHLYEIGKDIEFDTLTSDQFLKAVGKHNRRLSIEVRDQVYGASSGLGEADRKALEVLLWTHHAHVHRSDSIVMKEALEMIKSRRLPPVAPAVDLYEASIFCNAAVLASWTHIRVLPYLSVPSQYSEGWRGRYRVLDDAFHFYVQAWEKPMKTAFLALIDKSYTFGETAVRQVLADSTG